MSDADAGRSATSAKPSKAKRGRNLTSEFSRMKLMLAAEDLVGRIGISGVSARAIAEAAKFRNNTSVQYHFGSIEGLFEQLLRHRMDEMEPRRRVMLDALDYHPGSRLKTRHALEIICLPHLQLRSKKGDFPYATFLCQYLPRRFPGGFNWVMHRSSASPDAISYVIKELRKSLPQMPEAVFDRRLANVSLLFFNTLRSLGGRNDHPQQLSEEFLIEDSLRQAEAAMTAPLQSSD